jgi:tetratricopeptide (TPR) repeat protein
MMLERHYDDEALIALLHSGDEAARDAHLSACSSCAEMLESYRAIAEVLGEQAVWDLSEPSEESAARGVASLRAVAAEMETEDVRAERLVEEMVKFPRQWWTSTVLSDERYQVAGVVRRLISVSEAKIDTMPPDAVELAAAAIAITEIIDGGEVLEQLRGAAYLQHAYAVFYVGDYKASAQSIQRSQKSFEKCTVSEYALARLDIVRSLVLAHEQRNEESLEAARRAAGVFRSFGDTQRFVSARMSEAYLLTQMHRYADCLRLLEGLREQHSAEVDGHTRGLLLNNIGTCQWNLGRIADALQTLQLAHKVYSELGHETEAVRVRYNVALLHSANGQSSEARKCLREVQADFQRLGLTHVAIVAGLDLAEIALLENKFDEVDDLCRAAIRLFEKAGVAYSSEALTALTFLREAAQQRRATQEIVWHVKTYIRRLPDEPALLFAPAPLPPA